LGRKFKLDKEEESSSNWALLCSCVAPNELRAKGRRGGRREGRKRNCFASDELDQAERELVAI